MCSSSDDNQFRELVTIKKKEDYEEKELKKLVSSTSEFDPKGKALFIEAIGLGENGAIEDNKGNYAAARLLYHQSCRKLLQIECEL